VIGLRERVEIDGKGAEEMARLSDFMRASISATPQLHGLFLFDEAGRWPANSAPGAPDSLNYADRDYFRYLRDHDGEGAYIGTSVSSKVANSWILTVWRRVNHRDGTFAGGLTVTLSADLFQSLYRQFDVGERGSILLVKDTG
jgi:hypothetical protein